MDQASHIEHRGDSEPPSHILIQITLKWGFGRQRQDQAQAERELRIPRRCFVGFRVQRPMHDGASMAWVSRGWRESSSMQKLPPAMASRKILPRCPLSPTMAKVYFRTLASGSVVGTVPRAGTLGGWDGRPGTSSTCSKEAEYLLTGAEKRIRRPETPGPEAVCQVPCRARRGAAKRNQRVSYLSGRRILVWVWVVKVSFRIRADDDDDDNLDGGYNGAPLALQLGRGAWQTWDHPTTARHRGCANDITRAQPMPNRESGRPGKQKGIKWKNIRRNVEIPTHIFRCRLQVLTGGRGGETRRSAT
ncbi:hypothetical protein CSOJ01_06798 [Colletotrichum sojae]|uniref:Uncharacterized protein n=1 Tax=Colletotrichum sojae TaxID=2175907 RepID=A0A8H6MVG7_9PEZI|nr:hypothetical protein CSOJ01_06798 [Colletotrichum sojae]